MNDSCYCSVDVEPEDELSVLWNKVQTARKDHVCCECGAAIVLGQRYEYVKGVMPDESLRN